VLLLDGTSYPDGGVYAVAGEYGDGPLGPWPRPCERLVRRSRASATRQIDPFRAVRLVDAGGSEIDHNGGSARVDRDED
jgi:hypothetical protein